MDLTQDEVFEILKLVEQSHFDELHLELGELSLTVRKTADGAGSEQSAPRQRPPAAVRERQATPTPRGEAAGGGADGLVRVTAPMLGTFYRSPEPGAPPYVEVGSLVGEDSTIGLIEVMKLFTAVKAGLSGRIAEICAENGQLVEYGRPLCLIEPSADPAGGRRG